MNVDRLSNPYQKPILVEAQATYYPCMASVFIPKTPILRGTNATSHGYRVPLEDEISQNEREDNLQRSLRRTRKRISDYILCSKFDMFVTFTFANDRQNIEEKRQQMRNWLKNQRRRTGQFKYLIVSEFHKDGKSPHYHALFSGYPGKVKSATSPHDKRRSVFSLPGFTLGYTNVKFILQDTESWTRIARYLQKYITKDTPALFGNRRFWSSKGLPLPRIEDNPEKWYLHVKPDWTIETENGLIMRFNRGSHPLSDIFIDHKSKADDR